MNKQYLTIITRAEAQSKSLVEGLERVGMPTLMLPSIEIRTAAPDLEMEEQLQALADGRFSWLVLTSPNGVKSLDELLREVCGNAELPSGLQIAVQGPKTAEDFKEMFKRPVDFIPLKSVSEDLLEGLRKRKHSKDKFLVAAAGRTREVVVRGLRQEGVDVSTIALYTTGAVAAQKAAVERIAASDMSERIFTFFSPSAVEAVCEQMDLFELVKGSYLSSIGPVTSAAIKSYDLPVFFEAEAQTEVAFVEGLNAAIQKLQKRRPAKSE
jgi:uroporphyrinogen-III synthase